MMRPQPHFQPVSVSPRGAPSAGSQLTKLDVLVPQTHLCVLQPHSLYLAHLLFYLAPKPVNAPQVPWVPGELQPQESVVWTGFPSSVGATLWGSQPCELRSPHTTALRLAWLSVSGLRSPGGLGCCQAHLSLLELPARCLAGSICLVLTTPGTVALLSDCDD